MRLDANEVAINKHLASMENDDAYDELCKDAFDNLVEDDDVIIESLCNQTSHLYSVLRDAVSNEFSLVAVDYTAIGQLIVHSVAKDIQESPSLEREINRLITFRSDQ